MKGLYVLVVLSAVVCTVWSEDEFQDCNNTELKKCFDSMEIPKDRLKILFSMNKEEMDRVCTEMNRGLRCIDSYTERCVSEEVSHEIHRALNGTTQFIKKLCNPGPYQEEYLFHAPCLRQVSDDYEYCYNQLEQKIREFEAKLNRQYGRPDNETSPEYDSNLRILCCSIYDYEACFERRVIKKCGENTAKFVGNIFNLMFFPIDQDFCKRYLHGSDQCHGSSASRISQRSLLLLISLAMLSLYALRST